LSLFGYRKQGFDILRGYYQYLPPISKRVSEGRCGTGRIRLEAREL
jgi:hypothetical protein